MLNLHPREAREDGAEVVILPKEEYLKLKELAEDYEDLLDLEEARERNSGDPGIPYEDFRKELGLD